MNVRAFVTCGVAIALWTMTSANASTFRISQVYSNLDGSVQYVELTESAGLDGQHRLAGLALTSTSATGVVKQFVFGNDLPSDKTANTSIVVAAFEYVLPITDRSYLGYNCCYVPEFRMPPRFLAIAGATLDFAGVDRVTYATLPSDGEKALYRDGGTRWGMLPANGRCYQGAGCDSRYGIGYQDLQVTALEYYNAELDHYFRTAFADEIDALENGRVAGWRRLGNGLAVAGGRTATPEPVGPVCRFYIPPNLGDSHFYSASPDECAAVAVRFPEFQLETPAAFYAALPNPETGECPRYVTFPIAQRKAPVYRLWNRRADSNHRYTTRTDVRDEMIRNGYISEGYGPSGVAMCI